MKLEGGTVALTNNTFGVPVFGDFANMLAGVMVPPRMIPPVPMPIQAKTVFTSSGLTLAPPSGLEGQRGATPTENELAKAKEDESESKSSSDNLEGGSGEDQDADQRPNKKRYHRHTVHQIQEMERLFKECPHPDEKQRQELSRELKLSPRQIKFWFQNKRTQVKAHHERQDNTVLRAENEKLKAENFALRDAVRNVACPSCGGPASLTEMSFDEQQLRVENVRLREEIDRISAMAAKYLGRQVAASATPTSPALGSSFDGFTVPLPGLGSDLTAAPTVADFASTSFGLTDAEKPLVVELAVASMEELIQVAQAGEPLWVPDPQAGTEVIDHDAYVQRFPRGIGPTPFGLKSETSRHTGLVIMNSTSLVETLMDTNRWGEMFPSIISTVHTSEVLSTGIAGTCDGAIQLMYAEFQLPSPIVPTRESYFLRYSKRVDHLWVVVDVSVDSLRGNQPSAQLRCRRRPSGCVIEEMPSGYSKVTWVEHVEADNRAVHSMYQPLVNSGLGFGAQRWVCTLQRQCERMASLLATNIPARDLTVIPNPDGRRSMLKLAERMTNNFCGGVSASTAHTWVTLAGSGADDVRVVVRKSVDDPGRPPGIVLSAATSLWLPVTPSKVFQFLRDERFRTEWDILSNMGIVEEMVHVAKGQDPGNSVSLLRVNVKSHTNYTVACRCNLPLASLLLISWMMMIQPVNSSQSNMLILQECCTDESCSLVVYAPVDVSAMSAVLNGGDPDCVALLPSGFAVLPDGPYRQSMGVSIGATTVGPSRGSLLTVAFQILVDHVPTARLSLGSVATVNKLISNTVVRIKGALSCENAV